VLDEQETSIGEIETNISLPDQELLMSPVTTSNWASIPEKQSIDSKPCTQADVTDEMPIVLVTS